jgi:hypothetical protein
MAIGLLVSEAFGGYAPGQQIRDAAAVAAILAGPERHFVVRFEAPDAPAVNVAALEHEIAADQAAIDAAHQQGE